MCKCYDIFWADLPILPGSSVQQGRRPVLIVSNDLNNANSTVVSVVPLTSQMGKPNLPTHVLIDGCGLCKPSIVLAEQIISLDKKRLDYQIGSITDRTTKEKVQCALMIQLNIVA